MMQLGWIAAEQCVQYHRLGACRPTSQRCYTPLQGLDLQVSIRTRGHTVYELIGTQPSIWRSHVLQSCAAGHETTINETARGMNHEC